MKSLEKNELSKSGSVAGIFPPTPWGKVKIYQQSVAPASALALDELCRIYWSPINRYIICLGQRPDSADDLTQGFFEQLFSDNDLFLQARRRKGKLRTFVAVVVKCFVDDEIRRRTAIKRGGATSIVSLESDERLLADAVDDHRPDVEFDRQWGRALLREARAKLYLNYHELGKATELSQILPFLAWRSGPEAHECAAKRIGISTDALRMRIRRMRRKYRTLLREEIGKTIGPECSIEEELAYLTSLFQSSAGAHILPRASR